MKADYIDVEKSVYSNFRELKNDVIELMKDRINDRRTPTYKRKEFQGKRF